MSDIEWLKTLVANMPGVSLTDNDRAQNVLDGLRVDSVNAIMEPLYTRIDVLENERDDLVAALSEAVLQIEYLHEKFSETGSGNAVLSRARAALLKARTP